MLTSIPAGAAPHNDAIFKPVDGQYSSIQSGINQSRKIGGPASTIAAYGVSQ